MREPRPYQVAAWQAIRAARDNGVRRQLCVMFPGLGKTFAGARLRQVLGLKRVLVLVHRQELATQWRDEIQEADPDVTVGIEQGDVREADCDTDVVIGSIPTLCKPWRRHKLYRPYDLIQLDEADIGLARTWLETLQAFHAGEKDGPLLVGWTGTPHRHDGKPLANLFDSVVFDLGLKPPPGKQSPIDMGYLCPARAVRVRSTTSLEDVPVFGNDFSQEQLLRTVDVPDRNDLIVSAIESHATDRDSILVFVTGVEQAARVADMLKARGHHAETVSGKTPDDQRRSILRRFAEGETRILTNVDVLTRGTNIPRIDCCLMAHPTKSATRYIQGLSRGFRLSPETQKKNLLVLDVADVCGKHQVQSAAAMFGLRAVDALGQDLRMVKKVCDKAAQVGIQVQDGDTVSDIVKKIGTVERMSRHAIALKTQAEAIDLFRASGVSSVLEEPSEFPWIPTAQDEFRLMIDAEHRALLRRTECGEWNCSVFNGMPLGGLNLGFDSKVPLREADKVVKKFAGKWQTRNGFFVSRWKSISKKSRKWGTKVESKQVDALRRLGVHALPPDLTVGKARALIAAIVLRREARRATGDVR